MICPELPSAYSPNTMAAGARQIQSIRDLGIETEVVDMRGIPKLKYVQALPKIRRLARSVDLIHAHFGYCGWLAKLATQFSHSQKPIVMSFMGDDLLGTPYNAAGDLEWMSKLMVRMNRHLAARMTQVIVKSAEMAQRIPGVACTVIPNGVDINTFEPRDRVVSCRQLGLDPEELYVLFPGDPDNPRKGYPLAQQAVAIAEKQLGQRIQILPLKRVPANQVAVYMNACHAMLMTSLIEGSPNVVKEAMACNLPVVGVPVGDVHELLAGVAGCISCQRDAREIGHALTQLLNTQLQNPSQRSAGRAAILDRGLDLASVAERIRHVYQRALE